jgi:hypothetical protein
MTEITYWLAEATADRLERISVQACAFADEIEDIAVALEAFGIEPSEYEHRGDHPLVRLINALCEKEVAADMTYLDGEQRALLEEAAYLLRYACEP